MSVDIFGNELKRGGTVVKSDEGISLSFANNTYVRLDGESKITGNLNMALRKIENLGKPTNPLDATTKEYVDNTKGTGVIGEVKDNTAKIKGNMDFTEQYKIQNLPLPIDEKDPTTKEYVDSKDNFLELDNPFRFKDNKYEAKDNISLKGFKISEVYLPSEDGDVATKEYVDAAAEAYLQEDQGKYIAKGDIDMSGNTIFNIKPPIDKGDIVNKKYIDDNNPFKKFPNGFFAIDEIIMRKNKLGGLREPTQDGEAATKKYVDDLQTQHVDAKGNIKFGRNINLDNKRIFALKEPKKDNEAANKKYVDDTIMERIEEEKANFLPSDPATKTYVDDSIRRLVGGDIAVSKEGVFIKDNGYYRATAPLNIDNQKMENLPVPEEDGDAVNKKYVDDIAKSLTTEEALIRENGGFNLVDSYINMNFNNIRNLGEPKNVADSATKGYVDEVADLNFRRLESRFSDLNQLVSVVGSCYEFLKQEDYQFTFGGPILNGELNDLDRFNGFLVPANGLLKNFVTFSSGLTVTIPGISADELISENLKTFIDLYGKPDSSVKIFTLVKIEEKGREEEELGSIYFKLTNIKRFEENGDFVYDSKPEFKFIINQKFRNKEENFICSVNRGDIINIRSDYKEDEVNLISPSYVTLPIEFYKKQKGELKTFRREDFSLHTATLTFLFKENSFPLVF